MRRLRDIAPWALAVVVLAAGFAFLFRGEVQASRDLAAHVFPETDYLIERWSRGEIPWWLPNARLGQPFAALLYTQVFYAPRVLTALIFGAVRGPNVMHLFHAAWGFAGSFFALRRFGRSRAASFVGGAAFSLSPFFVELAQNLSFASVAAWFGWAAWAVEGLRQRPTLRRTALLALIMGCAFHAGAPEIWLQIAMVIAVLLPRARTALATAWGGAIGAVVALPAFMLAREWTVPGEKVKGALEWSVSLPQLLSIGIPDAATPLADPYWGGDDQRFVFTLFIGSLAVLLAVIGASVRRARRLVIVGTVLIILSLGRHFIVSRFFLELPPFSLFRYPAKYAIGALWCLSMLAAVGVDRLAARASRQRPTPQHFALVGLVIGLFIASRMDVREGFRAGAPWLLGAMIFLVVAHRWKWVVAIAVAGELIAAPIDRWERTKLSALETPSVLAPLLKNEPRISIRVDLDDVDREACGPWDQDESGGSARDRLTGLQFMREGLSAVGGYGFRDPWRLSKALAQGPSALSLVGVNAFVRETWAPAPPGVDLVTVTPIEDVWIWHASQRVPPGFFSGGVTVSSDDEAFAALKGSVESLQANVHVDRGAGRESAEVMQVDVSISRPSAERVEQRVNAPSDGVVVLTDAWDPGWVVEVDGVSRPALRAWGFVRAVEVTAGEHLIRWTYRPMAAQIGGVISVVALLLALAALSRRQRRA